MLYTSTLCWLRISMNSLFIWHFKIHLFYCGCFDCVAQSLLQLLEEWLQKGVLCYIKPKSHTETHAKPKTQHQCQPTVGFLSGFVCCASSTLIICQAQRVGNFISFSFSCCFYMQHTAKHLRHWAQGCMGFIYFLLPII